MFFSRFLATKSKYRDKIKIWHIFSLFLNLHNFSYIFLKKNILFPTFTKWSCTISDASRARVYSFSARSWPHLQECFKSAHYYSRVTFSSHKTQPPDHNHTAHPFNKLFPTFSSWSRTVSYASRACACSSRAFSRAALRSSIWRRNVVTCRSWFAAWPLGVASASSCCYSDKKIKSCQQIMH